MTENQKIFEIFQHFYCVDLAARDGEKIFHDEQIFVAAFEMVCLAFNFDKGR